MNLDTDYRMTIDGKSVGSAKTMDVFNPATGEAFAQAPDASREQLDAAVPAARAAFKPWRARPIAERQAMMRAAGDALMANADDLARLFTHEQGRPVDAAKQEIQGAAMWLHAVSAMTPPVPQNLITCAPYFLFSRTFWRTAHGPSATPPPTEWSS